MTIKENLYAVLASIPAAVTLVAVTKTHPVNKLQELYDAGHRIFGENKVQELIEKYPLLPKDIQWHLIGHLQTNKVKYIAPFIQLIHSVDSIKLLREINKQAQKNNRTINCLLQVYIASEETKFGLEPEEIKQLLQSKEIAELSNIHIRGLMGMASNTANEALIEKEFITLHQLFINCKPYSKSNITFDILSMGMSSDYLLAIKSGSNMIRVGSSIFGHRA